MADKLLMLALSPTMETGTITNWIKKEGDTIASGDVICEVETDKTTMEYETTQEGTILKILVEEGGQVKVGEPIGIVGEEGEDISGMMEQIESEKRQAQAPAAEEKPQEEALEKAEKPAPVSQPQVSREVAQPKPAQRGQQPPQGSFSSPLARKLAQDKGVDIGSIRGSGPGGRIVKRDVEEAARRAPAAQAAAASTAQLRDETIRVSDKRRIIAQRMAESFFTAPHYYEKIVAEVDTLLDARARLNNKASQKVSLNAFLIKLTAEALRRHPMVNAFWQGDTIVKHGSVDIGIAVAQPDGLITPVVRRCEARGIVEIDGELKELIEKARNNRLSPEEYTNATFTISNLGSYGIREFTAIINPPAAAILAVGETVRQPVVGENDELVIRRQMALTLSADHRILDGALSALFMKTLKEILENPIEALF